MMYAIGGALVLVAFLNAMWAYVNMMLADNEWAIGISAVSFVVCLFAAVYIVVTP